MSKQLTHMRQRQGFSLIELLISTAIATIIGSGVILVLVSQSKLTATQNRNMINAEQVRSVMNFMADEIEMMGNGVTIPFIQQADPRDFIFVGDIDNDGKPDRIRYFQVPTTNPKIGQLERTLSTSNDGGATWNLVGTDILLSNIDLDSVDANGNLTGFQFRYFGKNGVVPATTNAITAVQINLGLDTTNRTTAFTNNDLAPQFFVTMATIRNRSL